MSVVVLEEKVYAILAADGGVTTLAPATRILTPGDHQNVARPYIVHFSYAASPVETHGGLSTECRWDYQVSCFADTPADLYALAVSVREALKGAHTVSGRTIFATWTGQSRDFYEDDVDVHHVALEFEIWELTSP